jgi:hypothetical protein
MPRHHDTIVTSPSHRRHKMANQPRVSNETHQILRTESIKYQFQLGRPVSMGQLIAASLTVAMRHPDELIDTLTGAS